MWNKTLHYDVGNTRYSINFHYDKWTQNIFYLYIKNCKIDNNRKFSNFNFDVLSETGITSRWKEIWVLFFKSKNRLTCFNWNAIHILLMEKRQTTRVLFVLYTVYEIVLNIINFIRHIFHSSHISHSLSVNSQELSCVHIEAAEVLNKKRKTTLLTLECAVVCALHIWVVEDSNSSPSHFLCNGHCSTFSWILNSHFWSYTM